MPIPPLSVGENKLTKAVNLSRATAVQVQRCDNSRMGKNGRMELLSD
jgi:hypothetical protein